MIITSILWWILVQRQQKSYRLIIKGTGPLKTWPWPFCFTSTEARLLISDRDRGEGGGGRGQKSEGSIADTARKRPERPWTNARTMEVLRWCPFAIAQKLVHCAVAFSTAKLGRVTKTMSVALLLRNNLKQKKSNFHSPAPPPCSWSLLG